MAGARTEVAAGLSRIAGEFPGWRPWVSDAGRWWATRRGGSPAGPPEYWAMTVDADDEEGLRHAITEQERVAASAGGAVRPEPGQFRSGGGPTVPGGAGGR